MTPEEQLNETSMLLARAIALLDEGNMEQCRNTLAEAQRELLSSIEAMKLRAAHD